MDKTKIDDYFLGIAAKVTEMSTCLYCSVGAVIVDKDNNVISTGFSHGVSDIINCKASGKCSYVARTGNKHILGAQFTCDCLHAEIFAILSADREKLKGATLYVYGYDNIKHEAVGIIPAPITGKIIQAAGIKRICTVKDSNQYGFIEETVMDGDNQ